MKELSIFIDESGDFGEITERPAYYLVTLLFHDQKNEITTNVKKLEDSIFHSFHKCGVSQSGTTKISFTSGCRFYLQYGALKNQEG
jgi:hypothetical protein